MLLISFSGPAHVLVVRGLDEDADEEMIRYEFSKHAPIKVDKKHFGFMLNKICTFTSVDLVFLFLLFCRIFVLSETNSRMFHEDLHLCISFR